jgi:hypothetical protein
VFCGYMDSIVPLNTVGGTRRALTHEAGPLNKPPVAMRSRGRKLDLRLAKLDLRLAKLDLRLAKLDLRLAKLDLRLAKLDLRLGKLVFHYRDHFKTALSRSARGRKSRLCSQGPEECALGSDLRVVKRRSVKCEAAMQAHPELSAPRLLALGA